jgi:hypothetical protein
MKSFTFALLALGTAVAAVEPVYDVNIVNLSKRVNETSGEGSVAANGTLAPFKHDIGIGCGVNWQQGVSFGGKHASSRSPNTLKRSILKRIFSTGGLQGGNEDFGLGGGFTLTPETQKVGLGLNFNKLNATAIVDISGNVNGTFEFEFASSIGFICVPTTRDNMQAFKCTTGNPPLPSK